MADPTPLHIMLTVMQQKWENKDYASAVALAKLAAPYVHGRASVARQGGELAEIPDDELDEWDGGGGATAAGAGPG